MMKLTDLHVFKKNNVYDIMYLCLYVPNIMMDVMRKFRKSDYRVAEVKKTFLCLDQKWSTDAYINIAKPFRLFFAKLNFNFNYNFNLS